MNSYNTMSNTMVSVTAPRPAPLNAQGSLRSSAGLPRNSARAPPELPLSSFEAPGCEMGDLVVVMYIHFMFKNTISFCKSKQQLYSDEILKELGVWFG